MPGMLLFGRRWMIGSDDLFFPFLVAASTRVIWLVAVTSIIAVHHEISHSHTFMGSVGNSCGFKMDVYLLGYIVLLTGTSFLDSLIVFVSSRGTIFREEKRRAMPPMIYARLGVYVFELFWLAVGIYLIFIERNTCKDTTDHFISEGLVVTNLVLFFCVLLFIYLSFDTAGRLWYKKETMPRSRNSAAYGSIYFNDMIKSRYEENWKQSCKTLFCCFKIESSDENVFGFIARQFAESFHDQINLVPSDILAGLILLRKHQQVLEARKVQDELDSGPSATSAVISNSGKDDKALKKSFKAFHKHQRTINWKPFDLYNEEHLEVLGKAVHFASHTMAVYGWPGYLYRQNVCSFGLCRLCCGVRCCASCCVKSDSASAATAGDNCCGCNVAATKLALDLKDVEFVYVSYHDEVFEPPFFVAVDHQKKAIVVSCRGTMSLKDVLTDLIIEEERIPVAGGDPGWMAHSGMLHSARYVLDHLLTGGTLKKAFEWDLSRETDTYQLTLVGHSLGAGVASILAFLLRPDYPNLICFAYSPPGITFNQAAAKHSEDFIYSIVVGKDVIPRLNLHTFHELKFKLLRLIQETSLPKWRILRGCLCQCMLCCTTFNRSSHEAYLGVELPDLPPFGSEDYRVSYVGGKVIHFVKTKSLYPRYIGKKRAEYEAVWASACDLQSILISTLMWKDHLPDTVFNTLQKFGKEISASCGIFSQHGPLQDSAENFCDRNGANGDRLSPNVYSSGGKLPEASDGNTAMDEPGNSVSIGDSAKRDPLEIKLVAEDSDTAETVVASESALEVVLSPAVETSRLLDEDIVS